MLIKALLFSQAELKCHNLHMMLTNLMMINKRSILSN